MLMMEMMVSVLAFSKPGIYFRLYLPGYFMGMASILLPDWVKGLVT